MASKPRRTTRSTPILRSRATGRDRLDTLISGLGSPDLQTSCLSALKMGRYGGFECIPLLEQAVVEQDPLVEYCARTALDQIRHRLVLQPPPVAIKSPEEIQKKLESPYLEERAQAIRELVTLRGEQSLPTLLGCLAQETAPTVTGLLVRLVLSFRVAEHRDVMIRFVTHTEPVVRAGAVEGFWGWDDPAVVQAMIPVLKDPSPKVRGPAFVLIVRRGEQAAKTLSEKLLATKTPRNLWMRLAAIYALGTLSEPWARQILVDHIRDTKETELVRAIAREAIVLSHGPAEAAEAAKPKGGEQTVWTDLTRHLPSIPDEESLHKALGSKDPLTRVHGLQNAGRFPSPEGLGLLTRLLQWETDPLVLATLVKALGKVGGVDQAQEIRKFLGHEDARVRSNALESLTQLKLGPELDSICKHVLLEEDVPRIQKQAAAHLFASDPEEAIRHFRGMILGDDPATRQSALQILLTFQDERLLSVLRDALKDPRREVYGQAYEALRRVAAGWDRARVLLESFHGGEIVGEVVDGEPVSALLFAMNSPKSADRLRAMGKLLYASDPRVNVVFELNLTSRDSDVAKEAARTLRERHRVFTLPRLYLGLGEIYNKRTAAGMALVPQHLADKLPRGSDLSSSGGKGEEERLRWVGKTLFDAFEEDVDIDAELRTICLDIRAALEQMGSVAATPSNAGLTGKTAALPAAAVQEPTAAQSLVNEIEVGLEREIPEEPGGASLGSRLAVGAVACAFVGIVAWIVPWDEFGGPGEAGHETEGAPTQERSIRILDSVCLERSPEKFRQKFKNRRVSFQARLLQINDPTSALLRSGSVLFHLKTPRSSSALSTVRPGQMCEIAGSISGRQPDGSIDLEGDVKPASGP